MLRTFQRAALSAAALVCLTGAATAQEVTLDFGDAVQGRSHYAYDADLDGTADVVLSTSDPFGFNTFGPGLNMRYIREPGIEGTGLLAEDLRANFVRGAVGSVSFSYALSTSSASFGVTATVFSAANQVLSSVTNNAFFQPVGAGQGAFPENRVEVAFSGTAAYATFNFGVAADGSGGVGAGGPGIPVDGDGGNPIDLFTPSRYIIDDLSLTFAGTGTLEGFDGVVPSDPILPSVTTTAPDGSVSFNFSLAPTRDGLGVAFPIFIDPDVAVGYVYEVSSGPNVAAVLVPAALANGDDSFTLVIDGVGSFGLQAGVEFDITSVVAAGVSRFSITGIDTAAGLDPTDPQAFVTGLRFVDGGLTSISQTALTVAVPEPATYALWLGGLGALALRRRARRAA
jgi:PEP-CTERM motif